MGHRDRQKSRNKYQSDFDDFMTVNANIKRKKNCRNHESGYLDNRNYE